jgi:membrane fusion protein
MLITNKILMPENEQSSLFRREVFDAKKNTWLGDIVLVRPTSFLAITMFISIIGLALLVYLFWGEYTRKARAVGYVVPDEGVLKIIPQQAGLVAQLFVTEGQAVEGGDVLVVLNAERSGASGEVQAQISQQIATRKQLLLQDRNKIIALYEQQLRSLVTRMESVQGEIQQIDRSIELLKQRARISDEMLARQRQLKAERFISDLALQLREQEWLSEMFTLEGVKRNRISMSRDFANLTAERSSLPVRHERDISVIDQNLSALEQERIEADSRREIRITAPKAGTVTALTTSLGKFSLAGQPLMSIIPKGAIMHIDSYIPARAAGFIREGSRTLIQYHAFPYQKFGTHEGTVTRIARTALSASELPFPAPQGELYYVARIRLGKQTVTAYGLEQPLQSGMLADASILLERRTLFEWVFEPLYSIKGRLAT